MAKLLTANGTVKVFTPNMFSQTRKQYFTNADNLVDVLGRMRSGGAITEDEEKRFKSLLPKISDSASTWAGKLTQLQDIMTNVKSNLSGGDNANQVKGTRQQAAPLPYMSLGTTPTKSGTPLLQSLVSKTFPAGSVGGQCGDFVRKFVSKLGATYPRLGDSLSSKVAAVQKYGTSASNGRIGSVIVTKENPTYGHVAYIIGRNAQGWIVGESNFKQNNQRISYGRIIPFNSPKIVGVINPTKNA
jgi:hypothetical protein